MKQKLLFALLALIVGWTNANAQTDVTATYITNADFETDAAASNLTSGQTNPSGWTLTSSSGTGNTQWGTANASTTIQGYATSFAPSEGSNYFYLRCNWQSGTTLSLAQTTSELQAGVYMISFDAVTYSSNGTQPTYTFKVNDGTNDLVSGTMTASKTSWTNYSYGFTLTSASTVTITAAMKPGAAGSGKHDWMLIDNVKLLYFADEAAYETYYNDNLREQNGLTAASATNGMLTSFVVNGTFTDNVNGWTATGGFQNSTRASNQTGDFTVPFWENWNGEAKVNKMYQTINNIPNGTYKLKMAAFVNNLADPNDSQYVFANNDKTYLTTGSPTFYEVWTVVTGNTVEIGLEQTTATANWMGIDNVSLTYYGAGDVITAAQAGAHKTDWDAAKAAAEAALANADYANVTGSEKTALQTEVAKAEPTTAQGYDDATAALNTATNAFIAAKASYDLYAANNADLAYADPAKKPTITNTTTAASLITALRAYFESNALAEGVSGAVNKTASISNPDAEDGNNGWTWTGNKNNPANNEPWTDASGNSTHRYFDGGNWNGSNWTTTMKQTITLPAGRYLLTAKGRAATNTTLTMSVGTVSVELPHVGSTGNVFDRGWGDGTIEFETTGSSFEINVTATASPTHEWFSIGDFRLMQLSVNSSALADEWDNLKAEVSPYLTNTDYANVIGVERTNVNTALGATPSTDAEYTAAIEALTSAKNAFIAAKTNYDALVTEIAKAKALGMQDANVDGYAADATSTAITALGNTQSLKVDEYTFVTTNYQYGVDLGTWTTEGYTADNSGQHWDGTSTSKYKEQENSWGDPKKGYAASSWTIKFYQSLNLPAGDFVFKVAGRKASGPHTTMSLDVTKTSDNSSLGSVNDFPEGDTGHGINTSGATDYTVGDGHTYANNGAGRGWEWRYVKFTLTEPTEVKIAVNAEADDYSQWMSFCNYTVQTNNEANIALIEYYVALADAQAAIANTEYANVTGSEKTTLENAIAADTNLDKTSKTAVEAATTTLNDAKDAFVAAKGAYDEFVAAKAVQYEDNLKYASATKFAAIATAQAATATSAADATDKTNAILSAYRKYVESHALAEGVNGAENKTTLISDPNMDVTYDGDAHMFGAWQVFGQTNGTIQLLSDQSFTDGDGNANYKYADIYKNDNNAGIQQTINLEPGKYMLTVTARANTTAGATFGVFAGTARSEIKRIGNTGGQFDRGWNDTSVEFYVTETSDVNIGVQSGNGKDLWWSATRFRLVKLPTVNYERNKTKTGWGTICLPYEAVPMNGTEAYEIAGINDAKDKLALTNAVSKMTAGKPYIYFNGTGNALFMQDQSVDALNDPVDGAEQLRGVFASVQGGVVDGNYIMSGGTWYLVDNQAAFNLGDNRAYIADLNAITVTTSNSAKFMDIVGGDTNGINAVALDQFANGEVYNLQGQKVNRAQKGVFIVNGKKVVIK